MDIQKLTKKNQEFIHIATNQLIKDGKSDQEIKDILGNVIPELIENQKKELQDVDSLVLQLFGLLVSLLKNTINLKLVSLTKKCQKQIKHLGRCGLIPHSSF